MSRKRLIIIALVALWVASIAASFLIPAMVVDGPANLETGFKRLDIWTKLQFVCAWVAVLAATAGFVWRKEGKYMALTGFLPLSLTAVAIGAFLLSAFVLDRPQAPSSQTPKVPTQEADS